MPDGDAEGDVSRSLLVGTVFGSPTEWVGDAADGVHLGEGPEPGQGDGPGKQQLACDRYETSRIYSDGMTPLVRSSSSNAQTREDPMPSEHDKIDRQKVIASLNMILELELAGVVRYLHYSLMVFGHARIPIIGWMRNQATEGMSHASMAGEHVTALGGHPSLKIGKLAESHKHDIIQILQESLDHERATLREYYSLLELVVDKSVWLEDYARAQIVLEEQHISEVEKMMRKPGELHPAG